MLDDGQWFCWSQITGHVSIGQLEGVPDMRGRRNRMVPEPDGNYIEAGIRLLEPALGQPDQVRIGDLALFEGSHRSLRRA